MTLKTMLAAAAVTIGMFAHGALPSGTSFESLTAGATVGKTALEAADVGATWTLPADQDQKVTAWGDEIYPATRPKQFVDVGTGTDNYLGIKTTLGEYVKRTIDQQTIGDGGLYVDTLVKFTAADEDIAVPSDAKIGVWVKTNEDETENRLMISAGPWNGGAATVYDCGKLDAADAWKRLTVKALYNIDGNGALGFVVYVDGVAVGCEATKAAFAGKTLTPNAAKFMNDGLLFASIVDSNKLSELAVSGQGGIDDISFTDVAPDFAKDFEFITVKFNTDKIATLHIGDETFTKSPASILKKEGLTYWYEAKAGYISQTTPVELTADITIDDPAVAAFSIGSTSYATWADAVGALNGEAKITLAANYTMTETDLTASINNTGLTTLDLNGKTLTGCVNAVTAIAITNSTENIGALAYAENDQTMTAVNGAAVYVSAGKFDGFVIPTEETPTKSITGGSFAELGTGSETFYLAANVADGYEAVYAAGYWTVQEAAPKTAEVTISEGANVTVTVMAGETPVKTGVAVAVGTVLTITATPAKDYELATLTVKGEAFTSGSTYTVVEGDAGKTIAIEATATAIPYVAQIGENKYLTFAEAFEAAADGDTITLLADYEGEFFTGIFTTENKFATGLTIDLNKKTWTMTGAASAHERVWEDRCGNSFLIKNGSLKVVGDKTQKIAFYTYAETLEFNNVALDFSELAMGATPDPADPRTDVPIVSQNGNVKFTGTTTVKLAENQRLVTMLDRANPSYVPGTLTLDVNGTLPGDILLYSACGISVGENTTLSGKVFTGAAACSGFEVAGAAGSPFVAMVGEILPKTDSTSVNTRGGQLFTSVADANAAIGTTTLAKNIIVLQNATADALSVASGTVNVVIPADVTLTATTSLALNDAKVALAEGGTLVAPAALTIASDFVAPATGKEIKVAGEGPYTYTVGDAAPQGLKPGESIGLGNPGSMTLEQAQAEAAKLPIVLTADDTAAGLTTESLCVKAVLIGGAYQAVVDVKPEFAPAVDATAETPIEVGAANFSATVSNPVKGLYYYFTASATVDGTYAPAGDAVRAGDAGVTLTAPKGGAVNFYKLNAAVRPPVAK